MSTVLAWFAVWTRSRHEARVMAQLREKNIDAFLPTITRWSRWKDRKQKVEWPLFPGYCFVHISREEASTVRRCAGVAQIVSSHGELAAIPDQEIEDIRTLVTSELAYDPCPLIDIGAAVEVVSGPLRGVTGHLTRKGAHARLVLAVNLIGQGVCVEVDAADVREY